MAKEAMTLKRLFNAGMINEQSDIQLIRMRIEKDWLKVPEEIPDVDIIGRFWEPQVNPYWESPIVAYNWYKNNGVVWVKLEPEIVYTDGNGEVRDGGAVEVGQ